MRLGLPGAVLIAGASVLIGLSVPAIAADTGSSALAGSGDRVQFPHMNHVFVIMMENTAYSDLLNPSNANTTFIQSLASTNGLETDYSGVTHTSLPNYVAVTSGSTWGSNADDEAQANDGYFNHLSLTDELNQAGISWKGYMESMPSVGYTGNFGDCTATSGPDPDCTGTVLNSSNTPVPDTGTALYVRKHDPFMQYPDVFNNAQQAANVVPLTQLTSDLNSGDVAHFVWITPNECNDMHGGATGCPFANANTLTDPNQETLFRDGNTFLKTWVTAIMNSRAWTGNSAIFVTWDEGGYEAASPFAPEDDTGCCDSPVLAATPAATDGSGGDLAGGTLYAGGHVPMIVITRHGARGITDSTPANHYSLLQTIELNWGLALLGNTSDTIQVQSLAPLLRH
jgi:phosphatidylinositol-3-phosphatase